MVKHDQEIYFDKKVSGEDDSFNISQSRKKEFEKVFKLIDIKPKSKVLEIGPGTGAYTVALLQKKARVTVVDLSRKSLDILESRVKRLGLQNNLERVMYGDIFELAGDIKKDYYDVVFFIGVLHHFENLLKITRFFKLARQFLKSGGEIFGLEPNAAFPTWLRNLYHSVLLKEHNWDLSKQVSLKLMTMNNIRSAISSAGFSAGIDCEYHCVIPSYFTERWPILFKLDNLLMNLSFIRKRAAFLLFKSRKETFR